MHLSSFVLGIALGAAGVGAAWLLAGESPPGPEVVETEDASEILAQLAEIRAQLGASPGLGGRPAPDADAPRLEGAGTSTPQAQAATGGQGEADPGPDLVRVDASEAALERIMERWEARKEERKYAGLDDKALRAEVSRLLYQEKNAVAARAALETLLKRDLDEGQRVDAMTELGGVHRSLQDFERSADILRDARRLAGADSAKGAQAGYQLVWTLATAKEPAEALLEADRVLASKGLTEQLRPWARWAAAKMADQSGNHGRALSDWQQLLQDFEGKPQFKTIVEEAALRIAELGG